MVISELIKELQKIQKKHGDIEVMIYCYKINNKTYYGYKY